MSQELLFTSGYININGSNDIKGKTFSCHYVPDNVDLKMRINNLTLSENSSINFKILFNNQYPSPISDVSYQFIRDASINNTIQPIMKFNNEGEKIITSHYILQEIIVNRNKLNDYEIWSKIIKIPIPNEYSEGVDIMDIKKLENNKSFYDISYANYYTNVGVIKQDEEKSDRNYVDISFSSQVTEDEDITNFENFIVNLYEQDGDLVDTSGNEDDPSSNTINKTSNDFKISNLRPDISYNIEVHPVVNSSNHYDFKFQDFFRLKEMHVYTNTSMNSETVKGKISQIKYKYLPGDTNYSSVNLMHGLHLLEQDTNNVYIHKFRITTPNIYKCFQIVLNDSTNITNIKLIGDKNNTL
jgi:hypothetical protein